MRKYLAIVGVIFFGLAVLGLAVYVSYQDERYTQEIAQRSAVHDKDASSSSAGERNSDKDAPRVERQAPSRYGWYGFFRWPNGTTAWAIILTLIAIAEQTRETRKAAEATRVQATIARQALIAEFRPRVRVRTIKLQITDNPWSVNVHLVNVGGTGAHVTTANIELTWLYTSKWDNDTKIWAGTTAFQSLTLAAGEHNIFPVPCEDSRIPIACAKLPVDRGEPQEQFLVCRGEIEYIDDNGVNRVTAFRRVHHFSGGRFVADPDPEYEYED